MLNNQLQFTEFDFIFNCWCFMILNENKAMLKIILERLKIWKNETEFVCL